MPARQPNAKVIVSLPDDGSGGYQDESLHAFRREDGLYEILNVPFFAEHLHLHDVIRCEHAAGGNLPRVSEVVTRSSFGTVRFITNPQMQSDATSDLIGSLREMGCIVERGGEIVAVAVPLPDGWEQVLELLDEAYERGDLSYEAHR
jgi:hypothetical protein